MSDETPAPRTRKSSRATAPVEPAVELVEPAAEASAQVAEAVETEAPAAAEPATQTAVATAEAPDFAGATAAAESPVPAERVVYITAPAAPVDKGNRGIGSLIAVVSGLVYAAVLALFTAIAGVIQGAPFDFGFLAQAEFYIPVLFFVIGFVLLVLVVNRAAWWAYILGSLALAVFVYFGTIGLGLLSTGIITNTPDEAAARYASALINPFIIGSAFIAREVSMWVGSAISARGRKVKVRNAEARAKYTRELAEKKAEHERALAGA